MRLLLGLLAAQPFDSQLTGDASLNRRPMARVMDPLTQMGARFETSQDVKGRRIITVKGNPKLKGQKFKLSVASAQVKSALLLAGLYALGETEVASPLPSRDHTERMLLSQGASLKISGQTCTVGQVKGLKPLHVMVPGDFSSAAFFLVAGLLVSHSQILLVNVCINPTRVALSAVLQKMARAGALKIKNERQISGEKVADIQVADSPLKPHDLSGAIIPSLIDEIPIFCMAAARAQGTSTISNAQELRVKESDRLAVMASLLQKLGVDVTEKKDGMVIRGGAPFKATCFQSHGDHRIAMSFAVAALVADGSSTIEDVDCVATSFPSFFTLLKSLENQ
jgi:3-phosphoshikimate 1-carboxyvinyltransferase